MEYTEKQIEEIILKAYFHGVFEMINATNGTIQVNEVCIYNENREMVSLSIQFYVESIVGTDINQINYMAELFDVVKDTTNEICFYAKEENVFLVEFLATRASIQRIIDRSNKISFKEDE